MANNIKPATNLEKLASYISGDDIQNYSRHYKLNDLLELHFALEDMPNLENEEVKKSYRGGKWYDDNEAVIRKVTTEIIAAAKIWILKNPTD